MDKFVPLVDLGVITVPEDCRLSTFSRENRRQFIYYEEAINDANFSNPTRILKPGDKLGVQAFRQAVPSQTTSEERLEFCRRQERGVLVGARGVSLVFDQKRHLLPRGLWYSSLDQRERLWKDARGCYGVPNLVVLRSGYFDFDLRCFEQPRDESYAFFTFRDLSC